MTAKFTAVPEAQELRAFQPGSSQTVRSGASRIGRVALISGFVLLLLGYIEGWRQRTDYHSDAIPYLDIARAVQSGNWKLALNPQWSLGYPAIFGAFTSLFSGGPAKEWESVHLLNLLILLATWASFLFMVRSMLSHNEGTGHGHPALPASEVSISALAIFLSTQLTIDSTWLIGPDMCICCIVFLALALMFRLKARPSLGGALFLGVLLGIGYIFKQACLAYGLIILTVNLISALRSRRTAAFSLSAFGSFLVVAVCYISALSWAVGHFTWGESGSINYAWHVNKLQMFFHWQGGPSGYGAPIHPSIKVSGNPPAFVFGKPFPVTYPPFFNPPYYYEGYRKFFDFRRQLHAVGVNLYQLGLVLIEQPVFWVLLIGIAAAARTGRISGVTWEVMKRYWPAASIAALGTTTLCLVHLEGRYIASFLAIFGVLAYIVVASAMPRRLVGSFSAALLLAGFVSFAIHERPALINMAHHERYSTNPGWKAGLWLSRAGVSKGDEIAVIASGPAAFCTWAHIADLRIVGEMGNDLYAPAEENTKLYWDAPPEVRSGIRGSFQAAGAILLFADGKPANRNEPGWTQIPETPDWVYWLRKPEPKPNPPSQAE